MLHVASDTVTRIYPRGIIRRTTPPSIDLALGRWVHAYRPGAATTLCGRKVRTLHWQPFEDLEFSLVNENFHCSRCAASASR